MRLRSPTCFVALLSAYPRGIYASSLHVCRSMQPMRGERQGDDAHAVSDVILIGLFPRRIVTILVAVVDSIQQGSSIIAIPWKTVTQRLPCSTTSCV